jgi:lipopolysaccharide assembly outer membrane protein LptD (OstA)
LSSVALPGQEIPFAQPSDDVRLEAEHISRTGDLFIALKGNVHATIKGITVYADEAEYNCVTGELMPEGHVRIKVRESKGVTDRPADHPTDTPLRMPNSK